MASFIELSLMRCAVNSMRCVFNNCYQIGLVHVPKKKRYEVLKIHRIYIPKRSVICQQHLLDGNWHEFINLEFKYTKEYIEDMIDLLRVPIEKDSGYLEYPKNFKDKTGLSFDQFNELLGTLPTLHRYFPNDTKKAEKALMMYLTRLHKGDRYNRVCDTFNVSFKTGRAYIAKARTALLADFVPNNLGFDSMSREALVRSLSEMANNLYLNGQQNQAVIIADGTYVFCNKTKNFTKQKEFYTTQKKRHFFKPMVFVTTTGRFIEVFGPYKAADNDAKIIIEIFDEHAAQIEEKLHQGDVFLLDRGFRDAKSYLINKGFNVLMPDFIQKKTLGQLTTDQANASRMVTACRFAVETRNGHMKTIWRMFDRTWITYDLPDVMSDYRIGASLINRFYMTMESNKDDAGKIARNMLEKRNYHQNEFAVIIDGRLFNASVKNFEEGNQTFIFPTLMKEEFRLISLGNYQPSLVLSYIHEHIKLNGKFVFFIYPDKLVTLFKCLIDKYRIRLPIVVLAIFQSRFRKVVSHRVYILADQAMKGREGIVSYYCDCQHGRRVVGCCAHVLALITYLGYYRFHNNEIQGVSTFIDDFFIKKQPTPNIE